MYVCVLFVVCVIELCVLICKVFSYVKYNVFYELYTK